MRTCGSSRVRRQEGGAKPTGIPPPPERAEENVRLAPLAWHTCVCLQGRVLVPQLVRMHVRVGVHVRVLLRMRVHVRVCVCVRL